MKNLIKKIVPKKIFDWYFIIQSKLAAFFYGYPSKKMIIVGITGTKGKTSSSEFVWSVLQNSGKKTGLIGTAHMKIGDSVITNKMHMTMPGPWVTQKLLKKMYRESCQYVVMEVSSEGLKQYRHVDIFYDVAVFTNLSPEHLPSHNNSFDEYKKTKGMLFSYINSLSRKSFFKQKISIVNGDSEFADYYSNIPVDKNILYSLDAYKEKNLVKLFTNDIFLDDRWIHVGIPGEFNLYNALVAYSVGKCCDLTISDIQKGIESLTYIPGRMEEISFGQPYKVFIDYAHEKLSMTNLLNTAKLLIEPNNKIIVLFGAEGGGRDKAKRKEMAEIADNMADCIILTNVDPYDDSEIEIIEDIAKHIFNKKEGETLYKIVDRREAIKQAFISAKPGDIVLICGKGAEKTMVINGKTIAWDEQQIVRDVLKEVIKDK